MKLLNASEHAGDSIDLTYNVMALPSLSRDISPPPSRRSAAVTKRDSTSKDDNAVKKNELVDSAPTLAAIEAGEVAIRYHLEYFSKHLSSVARSSISRQPRMSMEDFQQLYRRNQHANGRHFVVHQHDHPVSGISLAATSTAALRHQS